MNSAQAGLPFDWRVAVDPARVVLQDGDTEVRAAAMAPTIERWRALLISGAAPLCVASRLDNGSAAVLVDLAVMSERAVHVALPPYFSPEQTAHALCDSGATCYVAARQQPPPGSNWVAQDADLPPGLGLWRRVGAAPTPRWPAGTACITYTSGTSGQPKGVCLDRASLLRVAAALAEAMQAVDPTRHLCALPLATLLETVGVYAALWRGAEVCLPSLATLGYSGASGLNPIALFDCLQSEAPHSLILVPQMLEGLLQAMQVSGRRLPSLRCVAVGGARVGQALHERAAAFGLPVFEGYGLSECASVVCLNRPGASRPGSVGQLLPHVRLRIDASGEIHVRGATLLGYLGEPSTATEEVATGDLGHLDDDGYLYLSGRRRNVFITSFGRNVCPDWVEAELCASGLIAQAVVDGEARPSNLALLVPAQGKVDRVALQAWIDQLNRRLPDYARIAHFVLADAPFTAANGLATANGRIRRERVLQHYAARIDAAHAAAAPELFDSLQEDVHALS